MRRVVLDLDAPTEDWARAIADLADEEERDFNDPEVRAAVALDQRIQDKLRSWRLGRWVTTRT